MQNKSIYNILGIILYRVLLDFIYTSIIEPIYNYSGFLNQSSIHSTIISYIALFALLPLILPMYKSSKLSTNIVVLLFLVSFVPMTSLTRFMPIGLRFYTLYLVYWGLLLSFYYIIPSINFSDSEPKRTKSVLWVLLIVYIGSILYVSGRYFDFRLHFNLLDVYVLRAEVRNLNLPLILKYLLPAAGNILPVFLVYFLYCKKRMIALFLGFVLLLDFGIGGHKTVVFNILICFLGYWFYNLKRIYLYSWVLTFILFLSFVENKLLSTFWIAGIGIRRALFLPSQLNYYYYDYFSKNEPDYLRQGILRWFGISSPYKENIANLIGFHYYGNIENSANNGLFSDAYFNFNALGVFIYPIILIIIFKLFDTCSKGLNSKLLILPIIVCTTSFISGTFSTVLLTGGILLLFITLYLMPRYERA